MERWNVERIIALSGEIHEMVHGQQNWKSVLEQLCRAFDGSRACIQRFDANDVPCESENSTGDGSSFIDELSANGFAPVTPLTKILRTAAPLTTYRELALVDKQLWRTSPIWRQILGPRDMYWCAP